MNTHPIRKIIGFRILTMIVFTYAIGIGIAHYLGTSIDWVIMILGLLAMLFLVEMRNFFSAYLDHPDAASSMLHRDDPLYGSLKGIKRQLLLQISLTMLTASATMVIILVFRNAFSAGSFLLYGIAFLLCYFSSSLPLRLEKNGYGELLEALLVATLMPSIALSFQGRALNFFLVMLTLPLAFIYLAMSIALSFEGYGYEIVHRCCSLAAKLGWQRAMNLHNLLIIVAFILIGVFGLVGLSWSFVWPMLLGLPVGGYEIYLMQQIAEGAKPRWKLLSLISIGFYLLMTYLIFVSLWIQ